jgi:hypothetical protein
MFNPILPRGEKKIGPETAWPCMYNVMFIPLAQNIRLEEGFLDTGRFSSVPGFNWAEWKTNCNKEIPSCNKK